MFAGEGEDLGCTPVVQHRINTQDEIPVVQRHRWIPPSLFTEAKNYLEGLLDKGVIKPSQNNYWPGRSQASAHVRGLSPAKRKHTMGLKR